MNTINEAEALREEERAANGRLDAHRAALVMLCKAVLASPEARNAFSSELLSRAENAHIASLVATPEERARLEAQADEYARVAGMVRPAVEPVAA